MREHVLLVEKRGERSCVVSEPLPIQRATEQLNSTDSKRAGVTVTKEAGRKRANDSLPLLPLLNV